MAVFFICGTPGPNMLHILTKSTQYGIRTSVMSMMGCLSAVILALMASAIGLGALLMASPRVFEILRYIGVVYLVYLGIMAWRAHEEETSEYTVQPEQKTKTLLKQKLYRNGLLIGLSNPKLILFAAAFFPQFIDTQAAQAPQYIILIITFAFIECVWYCIYGFGGQQLMSYLSYPGRQKVFNRIVGTTFIGFGLALLKAVKPG